MTNRGQFHPLLAAAILTLAACGSGGATNNADAPDSVAVGNDAAAPVNDTAAAPAPATGATPAAISVDYMVGKWSAVNEDCAATLEFKKDGTVTTPIGEAKFTITGDEMAVDYGDGSTPTKSTIKPIAADRIAITHASGTKETERRC